MNSKEDAEASKCLKYKFMQVDVTVKVSKINTDLKFIG